MAIALVQSASGTSTTATTNPAFSVAPTNGNLIVLAFASDDYNGTPNTGWTQSTGMEQQTFHGAYVWWRISTGANPPGGYTIGSATTSSWVLAEFSGCDAAPYDVSQGTFIQSSTTTMATPSITPTTGNRVVVAMVGGSSGVASLAGTYDSWTNSFTAIASLGQASGAATCTGLAYRLVVGNGSTTYTTTADYSGAASPQARSGLIISFKEGAAAGTTLTASGGSYTLTGTSAGLGGRAIADPGSYALSGTAATFAFKFTAEAAVSGDGLTPGSDVNFVITGAPVTLTALGGSYTLTGTSAGVGGRAIVDPGSYALTGTAMTWRLTAPVVAGAYALTGTAATFLHGMIAGNSGYTVNGTDITFRITSGDYTLFCNAGAYALTGRDAAFPGNEPLPPVQPSTGGSGYAGAWSGPKRRKRKRDEIEELIDLVQSAPPQIPPQTPQIPQPSPPALVDLLPKMEAAGLTPPQRKIVKRAIVTDDPDDDDEAIELLLSLLS